MHRHTQSNPDAQPYSVWCHFLELIGNFNSIQLEIWGVLTLNATETFGLTVWLLGGCVILHWSSVSIKYFYMKLYIILLHIYTKHPHLIDAYAYQRSICFVLLTAGKYAELGHSLIVNFLHVYTDSCKQNVCSKLLTFTSNVERIKDVLSGQWSMC